MKRLPANPISWGKLWKRQGIYTRWDIARMCEDQNWGRPENPKEVPKPIRNIFLTGIKWVLALEKWKVNGEGQREVNLWSLKRPEFMQGPIHERSAAAIVRTPRPWSACVPCPASRRRTRDGRKELCGTGVRDTFINWQAELCLIRRLSC